MHLVAWYKSMGCWLRSTGLDSQEPNIQMSLCSRYLCHCYPTYTDGFRMAWGLMCSKVILQGFLQCWVSVRLVAYYAKYTSMELYYSKEREQGQRLDFNMSLQSRTFSRTVIEKHIDTASPRKWEGNGYKWLVYYNISKKTELADSAAERRDGLILLWKKTVLDIRAEYW